MSRGPRPVAPGLLKHLQIRMSSALLDEWDQVLSVHALGREPCVTALVSAWVKTQIESPLVQAVLQARRAEAMLVAGGSQAVPGVSQAIDTLDDASGGDSE